MNEWVISLKSISSIPTNLGLSEEMCEWRSRVVEVATSRLETRVDPLLIPLPICAPLNRWLRAMEQLDRATFHVPRLLPSLLLRSRLDSGFRLESKLSGGYAKHLPISKRRKKKTNNKKKRYSISNQFHPDVTCLPVWANCVGAAVRRFDAPVHTGRIVVG